MVKRDTRRKSKIKKHKEGDTRRYIERVEFEWR